MSYNPTALAALPSVLPTGRILRLTLSKAPFEVMLTGEKQHEYRRPSEWIKSRLNKHDYDYVLFINGYSADRPWFVAEAMGWDEAEEDEQHAYSNYLEVCVRPGDFVIHLGAVVAAGNLA